MVASQIHLVRHGEVHNPDGILYGRLPEFHLSELGQRMAEAAASNLAGRGRRMSGLFSSPLQRTQESAKPISLALRLPVRIDDRLIEPTNAFEGRNMHAGVLRQVRNPHTWALLRNPRLPSWGEPYTQIRDRMLAAIEGAWSAVDGGDVVLVSHQLPIWTVHRALTGAKLYHDPRRRRCSLSSITTLERRGDTFVEVGYVSPADDLLANAQDVGAV